MLDIAGLNFEKGGELVTVVTQEAVTGAVLMVAHADREALELTVETGEMHYRSRSRGLWRKGSTSGNTQQVITLRPDCDGDAVLARVIPAGCSCHTGSMSCFGNGTISDALSAVDHVIIDRAHVAAGAVGDDTSYTRKLQGNRNLRLKKIGEEGAEFVTACADGDAGAAVEEAADLIYHLLVALRSLGVGLPEIQAALSRRA